MDPRLDPDYLKPVSLLPAAFHGVFPFRYFNAVQSESFAEVFLSDDNLVISAPTGSGKTVLFELCILRLLEKSLTAEGQFNHVSGSRKTVYIAPMKALVQDKLREWTQRFASLGVKCQELTSDSGSTNVLDLLDTDIILSTPEKFDIITRRHRDRGGMSIFADIALLLIDEVHLLSETRGAALEAVVSRLKMLARFPDIKGSSLSTIRFVAVSATVSNIEDLGEWLRAPKNGIKRFGEEYRPVKLTTTVLGYQAAKNDFLFERKLQHYLLDILMHHTGRKPSLVFCSTRKGAQETAISLAQSVAQRGNQNPFVKSLEHFDRLLVAAQRTNNVHMQQCIRSGVGFHNGGLTMEDRGLVEGLFLTGDLLVLCTTSTLAQGVNLPAHAVIIKSTQYYNQIKGCYLEYERSAVLQMSGRAGRPQFDDSGVVIIMTRKESVHLYQNLLSGSEPVESQLLPSIVEHLNAEIVLRTVTDCGQAIDWLKGSYLYVRIKKNPQHYNIQKGDSPYQLENKLKEICVQNVNELAKYGLVKVDEFGFVLTPLEPGRIMEKYYLQFETMKAITKAPERSTMEELLLVLVNAEELSWIKLRRDEKKRLNDINGDMSGRIRYHVNIENGSHEKKLKKRIQSDAEKIFVLVNDALSGEPTVTDFTMSQDSAAICTTGSRICRCMSDYFIFMKRLTETRNALLLSKCLKQRLWENTKYQLKQLVGVGQVTAKALVTAGIDSFKDLAGADPRRLEAITGRKFPYGDQLKACLNDIPPKVEMNLFESGREDQCLLTLHRVSSVQLSGKSFHMAELVVGSKMDNTILFRERIRLDQFPSPYAVTIPCSYASGDPHVIVVAALISEVHVGVDVLCKLALNGGSKDCEMWFNDGHGCQEPEAAMTHFYMSSPLKTYRSSINIPGDSKNAPGLELEELLPTDPLKSPPNETTAQSNPPGFLTASHSSDFTDTALVASLQVPAETMEVHCCTPPTAVTPQNDISRNPSRSLFRGGPTCSEETQLQTGAGLVNHETLKASPVEAQNEDVSNKASIWTQGPPNDAGKSPSRNICDGDNLAENMAPLRRMSQETTLNDAEVKTGSESNMAHKGSEPPRAVTDSPSSSLTTLSATPDLLSSDFRRKVRRTGFSSIPSFSSADGNAQRNSVGTMNSMMRTSKPRLLGASTRGGHRDILDDLKASVFAATNAGSVAHTNIPINSLYEAPDQPNHRRITAQSMSFGKRPEPEPESTPEPDLTILESISTPCRRMHSRSSFTDNRLAKIDGVVAKEAAIEPEALNQAPDEITRAGSSREPMRINERLGASSCAQTKNTSNHVSPYRNLKSFNLGFAWKSTSVVHSVVDSALKVPNESHNQESSNLDNRSNFSVAKRLEAEFDRTNTVEEAPNHTSVESECSCFKLNHPPTVGSKDSNL